MKKLLIAVLLAAPAFGVLGCQQDPSVKGDIANLKTEVASLQSENERLSSQIGNLPKGENNDDSDIGKLKLRLEQQEQALDAARKRIAELEKQPVVAKAAGKDGDKVDATDAAFVDKVKAAVKSIDEEKQAERQKAREARQANNQKNLEDLSSRLKEVGIDFDPKNPRQSGMQIMMDKTKRDKAYKVFHKMMDEKRLAPLKLDDYQTNEVLRIESDARQKITDTTKTLRESGATPEEIQQGVKQVTDEKDQELQKTLTPEQYDQYKKDAEAGGMMPDNLDNLQGLLGGMGGFGGGGRGGWGGGNGGGNGK